jgi:ribonuclease-3
LEEIIGYSFKSPELLLQALTHKSFVNENRHKRGNVETLLDNERLEFLGDAVLELKVSERIYLRYPDKSEGELSRLRSQIVNTQALARFAERLGLGEFLRLGRGEARQGGRLRVSLLADTFEALLAALYLDGAVPVVQNLIEELLESEIAANCSDYKTRLQECLQVQGGPPPVYELTGRHGADHQPLFFIEVKDAAGRRLGAGRGSSRKAAEQKAAANALKARE